MTIAVTDKNQLHCGDNLEVLRKHIGDESIDLCYIDPPFNSGRNYNKVGAKDDSPTLAFVDTWAWSDVSKAAFDEILTNEGGRFAPQTVDLIEGLHKVLNKGGLLAYLVNMTLRITEIHRALKPTGSFYLHCDPTAGHYLKIVLDTIFVAKGGEFRNEIVWHYLKWSVQQGQFVRNHDSILFYSKSNSKQRTFNTLYIERSPSTKKRFGNAKIISTHSSNGQRQPSQTNGESDGVAMDDVWDISRVAPVQQLYPTEKPESLLERIIAASSNEGDVILDAYCGSGTTVVVAEKMKRRWIGVDISNQAISLVMRRLEKECGNESVGNVVLLGESTYEGKRL